MQQSELQVTQEEIFRLQAIINGSQEIIDCIGTLGKSGAWNIPYDELIQTFESNTSFATGAFSKVHKARIYNQRVAVKIIKTDQFKNFKKAVEKFFTEAKISSLAKGMNLMILKGISCDKKLCLIYDFMQQTLEELINANKVFLQEKLNIAFNVATGMNVLHEMRPFKAVHRDLEPSNILISRTKQAFVADFGQSFLKEITENYEYAAGTVQYQPPEAYQGKGLVGQSGDVWAFGCILNWMLQEKDLWPGYNKNGIMGSLIRGQGPELCTRAKGSLEILLQRCLNPEQKERPTFPKILQTLDETIEQYQISPTNI